MRTLENNLRQLAKNHGLNTVYDPFTVLINRMTGNPGASAILKYLLFRFNICDQWTAADSQIESETGIRPTRVMKQRLNECGIDRSSTRDGCIWQINRPKMAKAVATIIDANPIVILFALSPALPNVTAAPTNITPALPNVTPAPTNRQTNTILTELTKEKDKSRRLVDFPAPPEKLTLNPQQKRFERLGVHTHIAAEFTGDKNAADEIMQYATRNNLKAGWLADWIRGKVHMKAEPTATERYASAVALTSTPVPAPLPNPEATEQPTQTVKIPNWEFMMATVSKGFAADLNTGEVHFIEGEYHINFKNHIPHTLKHPRAAHEVSLYLRAPVKFHAVPAAANLSVKSS